MTARFDDIIHAPIRLRMCGLLAPVDSLRFDVLRDELGITDAMCSKHLKTLADAGYVTLTKKTGLGRGYKLTWVALTDAGRRAFDDHVAALRQIVAGLPQDASDPGYGKAD